ncbi:MAG: hypothetical protein ACJ76K_11175, partial [Solirubrobacteraceae bacterium]
ALDTIAQRPEILQTLNQTLNEVVTESLGEAEATLADLLDGLQVGGTVDEVLRGRLEAVRGTLDEILQPGGVVSGGEAPRALDEDLSVEEE